MSSHGKLLNLFDPHIPKLQDVDGEIVPFPALVPYHEYFQNVLVYRMTFPNEIFITMLQEFTDRIATQTEREVWTWMTQWQVEYTSTFDDNSDVPASKRPRTGPFSLFPSQSAPSLLRQQPDAGSVGRRIFPKELLEERDLLGVLLDIVQVSSAVVPNFVEFLYRWIDYFEGDGFALRCALRREIPSLWDFEDHPVILPDMANTSGNGNATSHSKPNLSDFGHESERLQYREKKYGLQPIGPETEDMPGLINVPTEPNKRTAYFAACFRSRQRAIHLLREAGVTMNQIKNHIRSQAESPEDTPEGGNGSGLDNYMKDRPFYDEYHRVKQRQQQSQEKWKETQISTRLAVEAQQATQSAVSEFEQPDPSSNQLTLPPPLIPDTPMYAPRTEVPTIARSDSSEEKYEWFDSEIPYIPSQLYGILKSKLFSGARPAFPLGFELDLGNMEGLEGNLMGSDLGDNGTNYEFEGDDIDPDLRDDDDDEDHDADTQVVNNETVMVTQQLANPPAHQNDHPQPQQQTGNQLIASTPYASTSLSPGLQSLSFNSELDNALNPWASGSRIQRTPPSPIMITPPPPGLPFVRSLVPPVPVLLYYPKIVSPRQLIYTPEKTDAIMLGQLNPDTGSITLSHAVFLPAQVWNVLLRSVRDKGFAILETYSRTSAFPENASRAAATYEAAYEKLAQALSLITGCKEREEMTKRWEVSKRTVLNWDRGAIWEGWAAWIDRDIALSGEERTGAIEAEAREDRREETRSGMAWRRRQELETLMVNEDVENMGEEGMNTEG